MTTRPADWQLVEEDDDPTPGEPSAISSEAAHCRHVGHEIRAQVGRLRRIAADGTLIGNYADKLRSEAGDLAGQLERTAGRYERVATELDRWAPQLEHAQAASLAALEKARQADAIRRVAPQPGDPSATAAEQAASDHARADLAAAIKQVEAAKDHFDREGTTTARAIRDAIEDDIKDSWWDNINDWVDRNAGWLEDLTEALSWIATGLAIIALFIPGVNLIAILAIGFTVATLIGHSLLAASGNGSWFDVGLDFLALATFGTGRIAAQGLKGVHAATRRAATTAARREAKKQALKTSHAERAGLGRLLNARGVNAGRRRGARKQIDAMHRNARRKGSAAAREVRNRPLAEATSSDAFKAGSDLGSARRWNDVNHLRAEFPTDPAVQQASRSAEAWRRTGQISYGWGTATDFGDKFAGDMFGRKDPIRPYQDFKSHEFWRMEVGSTW
jgi:hypothetical protein